MQSIIFCPVELLSGVCSNSSVRECVGKLVCVIDELPTLNIENPFSVGSVISTGGQLAVVQGS